MNHITKEKYLTLLLPAASKFQKFLSEQRDFMPISFTPCWDCVCLELAQVLCLLSQTLSSYLPLTDLLYPENGLLKAIYHLWLFPSSHLLFFKDPWARSGECDMRIYIPLRLNAPQSSILYVLISLGSLSVSNAARKHISNAGWGMHWSEYSN